MSKVSVIIPVYNVEKYLRQCLDSVINQTLKDIEIICVNDGSTDNSLEILEEYAKKDDRIKVISQKNQGVSAARNTGLDLATGEYIQFIDSDDYIENDCTQKAYQKIISTQTDILCFGSQDIKNNIAKVNNNINFFNYITIEENSYITNEQDKARIIHAVWDKLYKKSFLDLNNIRFSPNLEITEDGHFNLQCLINKATFSVLNYVGYNRIDTGASVTANKQAAFLKAIKALKFVLESDLFLSANEQTKKIIFEKMLSSVFYYYDSNCSILCKLSYINEMENVVNYINKKIDKNIINQSRIYSRFNLYNKKKFILENLFCIKNRYPNNKIFKHICIFGIKADIEIKNYYIKKQNKVSNYLAKKYIKPYIKGKSQNYLISPKKPELCNKNIIWQYWGQGLNKFTPKIVQICFNSVNKYKGEYSQIILTDENISDYIDIPEFVIQKLNKKQITYAFFSDILRLCLLSAYGGIWIDATILFTDNLPEYIKQEPFFIYQRSEQSKYKQDFEKYNEEYFNWSKMQKINWLSSLIKVNKDYPLILSLKDIVLNYTKNENKLRHYFLIHLIFDYLTKHTLYKKYNCIPYDDTLPHLMQINFDNQYSSELWNSIISQSQIHKLTYIREIKSNSIGAHILQNCA